MKFSQRIGKAEPTKQMQVEGMDSDLKNGIWNGLKLHVFKPLEKHKRYSEPPFYTFTKLLWNDFFKLPIDTIPDYTDQVEAKIREWFYNSEWYEVYDLIEFVANINSNEIKIEIFKFEGFCNTIFEREFSGYRFIDGKICPITNENEISEIEQAINLTAHFTSFRGANIHLKSALIKLSDKKSPDYRNSIKESISAVESVAKIISENSKDSLGAALDRIKVKIKLHTALEKGFKNLYGYTSDSDGIRHALMEDHNCDFEDAKYMLVSSSAFINYLASKSEKAGIAFK